MSSRPSPPKPRSKRGVYVSTLVLVIAIGFVMLGAWIGRQATPSHTHILLGWAFATFLFGALVGFSEILSRYRDEPLLAAFTGPGASYLAFNGTVSVFAFAVLLKYPNQIFPKLSGDLFLSAVAAGFGAMVIFRSKLFTFKSSEGTEYPIGPAIVLDAVLKMIDSKIDRRRAVERQTRVFDAILGINDFPRIADFIEASLNQFQNLSSDQKKDINESITTYRSSPLAGTLKSLALGFAYLTIAGDENFDLVISNIKRYIDDLRNSPAPSPPAQVPASPGVPLQPAPAPTPPKAPSP